MNGVALPPPMGWVEVEARLPFRKHPQVTVMSVITVMLGRKSLI
jgi:hypothetical protein